MSKPNLKWLLNVLTHHLHQEQNERWRYEYQECINWIKETHPELAKSDDKDIWDAIFYAIGNSIHVDGTLIKGVTCQEACTFLEKFKKQKQNDIKVWIKIVDKVLTDFLGIGQYLDNPICQEIAQDLKEKYCFDTGSSDWDRVFQKGLESGINKGKAVAIKELAATWSKDDAKKVKILILMLEKSQSIQQFLKQNNISVKELIDWIKALSPYPQWKPSAEQMECLNSAIDALADDGPLSTLYEDLKTLM